MRRYGWLAVGLLTACGGTAPAPRQVKAPVPVVVTPAAVADLTPTTIAGALAARHDGHPEFFEAALVRLSTSPDPLTQPRALALLGLLRLEQHQDAQAVDLLTRAADLSPRVAPFLRLRIVDAYETAARYQDAATIARSLVDVAPLSSAATIARLRIPGLLAMAGDHASAEVALNSTMGIPIDELTEADFVRLGDVLARGNAADLSRRVRLRLLTSYTQGRYTEKTYGELVQAQPSPFTTMTFDELTDLASRLGRVNRYDQALDLLGRISARFPNQVDSALYSNIRARALFNSRKYTEVTNDPLLNQPTPAMQALRARAFWRSARPQEFLNTLARLQKKWPDSKEAIESKLLLAKYYSTDESDFAQATRNIEEALASGANDNEGENLWTLGWTHLLARQDSAALDVFTRYLRQYPDGDYRTNSLFWSAKILAKRNDTAGRDERLHQLIREYPYSYYASRSRQLLGDTSPAPFEIANGNVFPDVASEIMAASDPRIDAVDELVTLELTAEATREMKRIVAEHPDNRGLAFKLADLYVRSGEAAKANTILQKRFREFIRHGGSKVPQRFWEILFPLNYWSSIVPAAQQRNIDPYLMAGIIRQESAFEPTEVSNAGAVGLMQIMPAEATRIATMGGLPPPSRQELFDPAVNVAIGVAEYNQKLTAMNGNQILAIAAYNAGEEPVGRWLAKTPVDDIDLFVDSIPYAETRLYVKSVTRNQNEYRRIYEHRTTSPPS